MARAQCLVIRGNRVLMVRHRVDGVSWWCLPGGAVEVGEAPDRAALRELAEECVVTGRILRQTSHVDYGAGDEAVTFLVDIADQSPSLGHDPECQDSAPVLVDQAWLMIEEIPERDRAFLWAGGLLGIRAFWEEVESWSDTISYPAAVRLDPALGASLRSPSPNGIGEGQPPVRAAG